MCEFTVANDRKISYILSCILYLISYILPWHESPENPVKHSHIFTSFSTTHRAYLPQSLLFLHSVLAIAHGIEWRQLTLDAQWIILNSLQADKKNNFNTMYSWCIWTMIWLFKRWDSVNIISSQPTETYHLKFCF